MTRWPATARACALVAGLFAVHAGPAAPTAAAACLELAAARDGAALARVATPGADGAFALHYVHSVTRTPVVERYRVEDNAIVQSAIEFEQHGPGLPTEADAGERFERRDGHFVVTMQRRFDVIVMRVHADQVPRLAVAGHEYDLAAWGNRALALRAQAAGCGAT